MKIFLYLFLTTYKVQASCYSDIAQRATSEEQEKFAIVMMECGNKYLEGEKKWMVSSKAHDGITALMKADKLLEYTECQELTKMLNDYCKEYP